MAETGRSLCGFDLVSEAAENRTGWAGSCDDWFPSVGFALEVTMTEIQYVSDESGQPTAVIVPIELWREIESEKETAYLLKSENMKRRLLEARERKDGIPFEEALEKLGI